MLRRHPVVGKFKGEVMSAETKSALESAIAAHIADANEGDIIGAWVVVVETTSLAEMDDDRSSWFTVTRDMQSTFTPDGLLWSALNAG